MDIKGRYIGVYILKIKYKFFGVFFLIICDCILYYYLRIIFVFIVSVFFFIIVYVFNWCKFKEKKLLKMVIV